MVDMSLIPTFATYGSLCCELLSTFQPVSSQAMYQGLHALYCTVQQERRRASNGAIEGAIEPATAGDRRRQLNVANFSRARATAGGRRRRPKAANYGTNGGASNRLCAVPTPRLPLHRIFKQAAAVDILAKLSSFLMTRFFITDYSSGIPVIHLKHQWSKQNRHRDRNNTPVKKDNVRA